MTDKMEQDVSSGAIAIQSNRDTNIGFTPEQVMDAIANALPAFGQIAKQVVEARVADFKAEVLEKLAANEARIDAFSDPAFVNTLNTAEKSYAFSDDDAVQSILVDLITKRSQEQNRSRKSLTFDQAVEVAGVLTPSEFAALSLTFVFRFTANNAISGPPAFVAYLNRLIDAFIDDVSPDDPAYLYLESQRCASISIGNVSFEGCLADYGGVISQGFARAVLDEIAPGLGDRPDLIIPCFHNPANVQLAALNKRVWQGKAIDLQQTVADALWATFEGTFMNKDQVLAAYSAQIPNLKRFADLWDRSPLCRLQLTTLGICIGYTNAKRVIGFDADLDIWIK
jgi:hypothetical protein